MTDRLRSWVKDTLRTFVPLRFESVSNLYDAAYAERTERFANSAAWQRETADLMRRAGFSEGKKVLDYGCNSGDLVSVLQQQAAGFDYHGIDINDAAIARCRERFGAAYRFSHYDGESLPMLEKEFDIVLLNHSLGHVASPEKALGEVFRVLKERGVIAIATPNRLFKAAKILPNLMNGYKPDPTVLRYFTPASLAALLRRAGFVDADVYIGGEAGLAIFKQPIVATSSRLFAIAHRPRPADTDKGV